MGRRIPVWTFAVLAATLALMVIAPASVPMVAAAAATLGALLGASSQRRRRD